MKTHEPETRGSEAEAMPRPARVLLADDDAELRSMLRWWLEQHAFAVTECADGVDLLGHLASYTLPEDPERFDVVVTDVRMPGATGLQVLAGLVGRSDYPPIILITAFGDPLTHQLASQLGAAAMLDKPFDPTELVGEVRRVLGPARVPAVDMTQGDASATGGAPVPNPMRRAGP